MKNLSKEELRKQLIVGAVLQALFSALGCFGMLVTVAGIMNGTLPLLFLLGSIYFAYKLGPITKQNERLSEEYESRID